MDHYQFRNFSNLDQGLHTWLHSIAICEVFDAYIHLPFDDVRYSPNANCHVFTAG